MSKPLPKSLHTVTAIKNAANQARLFNRDPDAMFVCADPEPKDHAERDRFGFAWIDGGEGERPIGFGK